MKWPLVIRLLTAPIRLGALILAMPFVLILLLAGCHYQALSVFEFILGYRIE